VVLIASTIEAWRLHSDVSPPDVAEP